MSIIYAKVGNIGEEGVIPNFVYINTNNTLDEVQEVGYLNPLISQAIPLSDTQLAVVLTRNTPSARAAEVKVFNITYDAGNWSLVNSSFGSTVSYSGSLTIGDIPIWSSTTGNLIDSGITFSDDSFPFVSTSDTPTSGEAAAFIDNRGTLGNANNSNVQFASILAPSKTTQSITTTTVLSSSSFGKMIICSGGSSYTVTLPSASGNANKWFEFSFQTSNYALVTIAPPAGTLDGQSSITFGMGEGCQLFCDGTNYWLYNDYFKAIPFSVYATGPHNIVPIYDPIPYNNTVYGEGNFFNTTTYFYTPLYPGVYRFTGEANIIITNNIGLNIAATVQFNSNSFAQYTYTIQTNPGNISGAFQADIKLNGTTDNVQFGVVVGNTTVASLSNLQALTFAMGSRISRY